MAAPDVSTRILAVRQRVDAALATAKRQSGDVTILAVSKCQPVEAIKAAAQAGIVHFGESYLNEAIAKIRAEPQPGLVWHFIGGLQTNKTRLVAEHFAWVHSVDRVHIAQRLSEQRSSHLPPLNVCIQVNIAEEQTKGGVNVKDLEVFAAAVAELPRLRLRGLMCIPPADKDFQRQRTWFSQMRNLRGSLNDAGLVLDTLSMGMSADLEAAVLEGTTIIRIGTAIFGSRDAKVALPTFSSGNS